MKSNLNVVSHKGVLPIQTRDLITHSHPVISIQAEEMTRLTRTFLPIDESVFMVSEFVNGFLPELFIHLEGVEIHILLLNLVHLLGFFPVHMVQLPLFDLDFIRLRPTTVVNHLDTLEQFLTHLTPLRSWALHFLPSVLLGLLLLGL
mmetsp:Transcript_43619/g.42122  ORF Transcript_43619/g.42122 Transcript_43619/m.42122 type:complete len:147 (+) Transcript_43619:29-469(+)